MHRMRTPRGKGKILKDYLNGRISTIVKKCQVRDFIIYRWLKKYKEEGFEGLKSRTGKSVGGYNGIGRKKPKNKIEEPVILHTDQGSVYSSTSYNNLLKILISKDQ